VQRLLTAPDQDDSPVCRIITVVTGRAASAAADLLSFGQYAVAYPGSTVFYHGVRFSVDHPLTFERASEYAESLRWGNDAFAMGLARGSVRRIVFRYAMAQRLIAEYRAQSRDQQASDLSCFLNILSDKLSPSASRALRQAKKRYDRYEVLVSRVLARAKKHKKFKSPKRGADFEEVILRELISVIAARNKDQKWTFRKDGGLAQLNDDFSLLLEFIHCYDGDDLQAACSRWGAFFLSPEQQQELKAIEDEPARVNRRLEMLKPVIRPIWLFFVALCHSLQEGEENDLTGEDACWLGLVDEVIGMDDPVSPRSFVEWEEDPEPPIPEDAIGEQATAV
jgi:hypothetical protein